MLTVCNAGALATADYGTALGVFYKAHEQKKQIEVFACETRPLLQGARLTAWELLKDGIKATLLCESMVADIMRIKMIDSIFTGADRIASNGDAANKIGTYNLAVLARHYSIPLYVVAPLSSFDISLSSGRDIPIEQREKEEITHFNNRKIVRTDTKVYNPAFDVTPQDLIAAIVTEKGIIRPPFRKKIVSLLS
ncbi:S-methyl-5-thioribose-1-phosphate isomerase [Candidatus Omnitrophota bacterium]